MWLTNLEIDELKKVSNEHRKECPSRLYVDEASGGGIGTRIIAKCPICKKEFDVTYYLSW